MNGKSTAITLDNNLQAGNLTTVTTYQAGILQASSNRILQKHCDEVLKKYGLTKNQWLLIGAILDSGDDGIRLTELTHLLGTTMAYITTTLTLLELKGCVKRSSNSADNRSKIVTIDPNFVDKCSEIEHYLRAALRKSIYKEVSYEDFRIYLKVMNQLARVS